MPVRPLRVMIEERLRRAESGFALGRSGGDRRGGGGDGGEVGENGLPLDWVAQLDRDLQDRLGAVLLRLEAGEISTATANMKLRQILIEHDLREELEKGGDKVD
jgi:hypothetical protein